MNIQKKFGKTLRNERLKFGISQENLAHKAGVHRNYIGLVERGGINITLKNIYRIAKALKILPAKLLVDIKPVFKEQSTK